MQSVTYAQVNPPTDVYRRSAALRAREANFADLPSNVVEIIGRHVQISDADLAAFRSINRQNTITLEPLSSENKQVYDYERYAATLTEQCEREKASTPAHNAPAVGLDVASIDALLQSIFGLRPQLRPRAFAAHVALLPYVQRPTTTAHALPSPAQAQFEKSANRIRRLPEQSQAIPFMALVSVAGRGSLSSSQARNNFPQLVDWATTLPIEHRLVCLKTLINKLAIFNNPLALHQQYLRMLRKTDTLQPTDRAPYFIHLVDFLPPTVDYQTELFREICTTLPAFGNADRARILRHYLRSASTLNNATFSALSSKVRAQARLLPPEQHVTIVATLLELLRAFPEDSRTASAMQTLHECRRFAQSQRAALLTYMTHRLRILPPDDRARMWRFVQAEAAGLPQRFEVTVLAAFGGRLESVPRRERADLYAASQTRALNILGLKSSTLHGLLTADLSDLTTLPHDRQIAAAAQKLRAAAALAQADQPLYLARLTRSFAKLEPSAADAATAAITEVVAKAAPSFREQFEEQLIVLNQVPSRERA